MSKSISSRLDRTGVAASVFCALHCAAAPILLLAAPGLGGLWVHPLSHLAIAALVLPVAALALRGGFRTHGQSSIVILGGIGIALVVLGAILPYLTLVEPVSVASNCNECCPSIVVDEATGARRLNVPPASIVTLLGGAALIAAHLKNLRCCSRCLSNVSTVS